MVKEPYYFAKFSSPMKGKGNLRGKSRKENHSCKLFDFSSSTNEEEKNGDVTCQQVLSGNEH